MTTEKKAMAVFDGSGELWQVMMDEMLACSARIIALRGAGSFNGISIVDAKSVLDEELIPRMNDYLRGGRVSVIYDGDDDDHKYPDIGYIMGCLRDCFGDRADWYAVQTQGWYKYKSDLPDLRPLHSANGGEYRTVVFPDKKFIRDHDHFSQHERLVRSTIYEQWYIGACGLIASTQLADYSAKAAGFLGEHKALIFRAPVSIEQELKIREKIACKTAEGSDPEGLQRLKDSFTRRAENPYGLLCTPAGEFLSSPEYANLTVEVV